MTTIATLPTLDDLALLGPVLTIDRDSVGEPSDAKPTLDCTLTDVIDAFGVAEDTNLSAVLHHIADNMRAADTEDRTIGQWMGIEAWQVPWSTSPVEATRSPIGAYGVATYGESGYGVEPAAPVGDTAEATMAELFPMVPAKLREEAVSTAAEIAAVTESMRAVLERAQRIFLETDALGSALYKVFAASGLDSSVEVADAALLFCDTMTGNRVLGDALSELSELAAID